MWSNPVDINFHAESIDTLGQQFHSVDGMFVQIPFFFHFLYQKDCSGNGNEKENNTNGKENRRHCQQCLWNRKKRIYDNLLVMQ